MALRLRRGHDRRNFIPPLRRKVLFEALENRLLLSADPLASLASDGLLSVDLTDGDDQVVVQQVGDAAGGGTILDLTRGAITERYGADGAGVSEISLLGRGGNDTFRFLGVTIATRVDGGAGDDAIYGGNDDDSLIGGAGDDAFYWNASTLGTADVVANGIDIADVDTADADVFHLDGLLDELSIGGTTLDALGSDTALGNTIDANNSIAYNTGVIQIDVNLDGSFNAANDFQIDISGSGVTTVTFDVTDQVLTFA